MSPSSAKLAAKFGLLLGLLAVALGLIPYVMGLHAVKLGTMNLTADSLNDLKSQPNGEKLTNCALACVALTEEHAQAYTTLSTVSKFQSQSLIFGGLAVVACFGLHLRFITQHRQQSSKPVPPPRHG